MPATFAKDLMYGCKCMSSGGSGDRHASPCPEAATERSNHEPSGTPQVCPLNGALRVSQMVKLLALSPKARNNTQCAPLLLTPEFCEVQGVALYAIIRQYSNEKEQPPNSTPHTSMCGSAESAKPRVCKTPRRVVGSSAAQYLGLAWRKVNALWLGCLPVPFPKYIYIYIYRPNTEKLVRRRFTLGLGLKIQGSTASR